MDATIKIRRSPDGTAGSLETYTVEVRRDRHAARRARRRQGQQDGTLAYRKSCRMAVCGSCGMRMDGGAVLACKTAMRPLVEAGHVPTISAMGNLPGDQGPGRRHDAVLGQDPRGQAVPAVRSADARRRSSSSIPRCRREEIGKEALCIHVRLLRLGVQLDGGRSRLPRAGGAREGAALRRRPARHRGARAAAGPLGRARHLGLHALLLLQRALPQGRRPARRDRQARRRGLPPRADAGRGREARARSSSARRDTGGSSGDRARAQDDRPDRGALKDVPFALRLARAGKVPNPLSPHKAKNNDQVKRLWKLLEAETKARPDARPSTAQEQ